MRNKNKTVIHTPKSTHSKHRYQKIIIKKAQKKTMSRDLSSYAALKPRPCQYIAFSRPTLIITFSFGTQSIKKRALRFVLNDFTFEYRTPVKKSR